MAAPTASAGAATMTATRIPALYVPHGAGPCFFIDRDPPATWQPMGNSCTARATRCPPAVGHPDRVRALGGSALHGRQRHGTRPAVRRRRLPAAHRSLRCAPDGDPALATRVASLLVDAGLPTADDPDRRYDHGVFIPLMLRAPAADIPVVQLSLRAGLDPAGHDAVGRALRSLRDEGVLIVGSGMGFHNMRGCGKPAFGSVSDRFDAWLALTVAIRRSGCARRDAGALGRASRRSPLAFARETSDAVDGGRRQRRSVRGTARVRRSRDGDDGPGVPLRVMSSPSTGFTRSSDGGRPRPASIDRMM